jgi:hypothetical protein
MSVPNKPTRQEADRLLIEGITSKLSTVTTVSIDGTSYTPSQIVTLLQAEIDATDAVGPAHAAWLAAVDAQRAATNKLTTIKSALRSFVVNMFGTTSSVLVEFGYTKQAQKPTAITKVAAVDKRNTTRKARHTMGKRQKADITGVSPVVAPAAVTKPASS